MAFDLTDCLFSGPALPEPFVKFELEKELIRLTLLIKTTGDEGKKLKEEWSAYRRKLYALSVSGGPLRVRNHVLEPLLPLLGYSGIEDGGEVQTREDLESGGTLFISADGAAKLRVWTTGFDEDLYAPSKRGNAWRFSPTRIAQRILLTTGERIGLLSNGVHLLILISDPARPDSTVTIPIESGWKRSREIPDSFRLFLALFCPAGIKALPDLVEKARLQQVRVTKELRVQARHAVEQFIQEVLDNPANSEWLALQTDRDALAKQLWHEGLFIVYRLLFVFKLESTDDPARSFSFASTSLWRNTFSPSTALAPYARKVLDSGAATGSLLENGIRNLFRMFEDGIECTELVVKPLGGALFGKGSTPILSDRAWGERAVAKLFDKLLWTSPNRGSGTRERVHYGPLDVEDLGRVYEALLELEPGISSERMCRLRRSKLEVVVPFAQGEKYRPTEPVDTTEPDDTESPDTDDSEPNEEETPAKGKKTKVEWIEEIPENRFYLRVGLGRKATGSYYTPHSFVRFLIQETLGPQVEDRSPKDNPQPMSILKLKVLDPAMGSGHFLVEACRFLGDKLYESCRLCDDKATALERKADSTKSDEEKQKLLEQVREIRQRVIDLPDPEDELLRYLPSRSVEREASGFSQKRAEALCRRLIATHCLYGVDKNPLAVELAKVALWLESHAEGMPLTFMDHRLVAGDSLTGPFWDNLIFNPGKPEEPIENLFHEGLNLKLAETLRRAIRQVQELEATVGTCVADIQHKLNVKAELDRALLPFHIAAAAWSGGVMLGSDKCDDTAYGQMLQTIGNSGDLPENIISEKLRAMIAQGLGVVEIPQEKEKIYQIVESGKCAPALSYDLTFPEVFYPSGQPWGREGFDAVVGNPPWDTWTFKFKEWFAGYNFEILDLGSNKENEKLMERILENPEVLKKYHEALMVFEGGKRIFDALYKFQKVFLEDDLAGRFLDLFRIFMERNVQLINKFRSTGVVVPGAFHSNAGAAGVRNLYIRKMALKCCFSFENSKKLFEIHSSFKYAVVVARTGETSSIIPCAFYLENDEWLFREEKPNCLQYPINFILQTTGEYLSLLEIREIKMFEIVKTLYENCFFSRDVFESFKVNFATNPVALNLTKDKRIIHNISLLFKEELDARSWQGKKDLLAHGYFPLYEGKHIHQFIDNWGDNLKFCVPINEIAINPHLKKYSTFFFIGIREVTCSTNERTCIATILPPGSTTAYTVVTERDPGIRKSHQALLIISIMNSYPFDAIVRLQVQTHLTLTILRNLPFLKHFEKTSLFLSHSALRLSCNHTGYAPLWTEQVANAWREPSGRPPLSWPVLQGDDERWEVRSAIDAVVAEAYGLDRSQYEHVLSTFSHSSYKKAPQLCLAKFDELKETRLEAFTKKYDPYWDIPLNENLPKPVIELPGVSSESAGKVAEDGVPYDLVMSNEPPKKRKNKRK